MKIVPDKKILNVNPIFEELFSQISPEIASTFTKEQIAAIKQGVQRREWYEHSLDLRISVPIPLLSFYLVLLVGEERRSKQRLQYEKSLYPFWTFGNILFLILFFFMIVSGSISTLFLFKSLIPTKTHSVFPTSIPWINTQQECEKLTRTWNNNKCWDNEHSSTF
ncbi:hypothetical protein H6G06_11440 [Anabaena sphaerica FACHB-251]|uniref:Uncharacterized protein n=1 Tax=Anabaena sphaerica FACHB-251 TaxID=2692883 RepID=A0A926WJ28_9NOST|nr:hypothetical protein [Anabaena sphaerica]MBD2294088.1 hypothetical protein [Anabaena sphaerica FACHB-251]